MKKIQVSIPDPTYKQMLEIKEKEGYDTESEIGRHIIEEWLILRKHGIINAPTASLTETPENSNCFGPWGLLDLADNSA